MKCVYRKIVSYRVKYQYTENFYPVEKGKESDVFEEFADCYEGDCPAYNNGKCLKVLVEYKNGQVKGIKAEPQ